MLRKNILDLISKQYQGRKSHLSSLFLTDGCLKHAPEMLAYRIFISKSLAHLIPFFPNLIGEGSITYLPWIHKDFTDEGSLKKWEMASILCYVWHDLISHLRENLQWNILIITVLLCCHFPVSRSDFSVLLLALDCTDYSRSGGSVAGTQWQRTVRLGCTYHPWAVILHRRLSWGTHYWITLLSMYKQSFCPF